MTKYIVLPDQSLFDIAIEVYGDVNGVFWLLADNPTVNAVADRLHTGQVLAIRNEVLNPRQKAYLNDFAPFQTIQDEDKPSGIGYWRIDEYEIQ